MCENYLNRLIYPFCSYDLQEKIISGNRIFITVNGEGLDNSSLVSDGTVSRESASSAAVLRVENAHSGDLHIYLVFTTTAIIILILQLYYIFL